MEREADLLPVNYMHVVFTIPDKLNYLFLHHQVDCYNILFQLVNEIISAELSGSTCILTHTNDEALYISGLLNYHQIKANISILTNRLTRAPKSWRY